MKTSQSHIAKVFAWEALDSRGRPTIACEITLKSGVRGEVLVPAGASAGSHEVLELRDNEARFGGFGVKKAVSAVNSELSKAVHGLDIEDHSLIDSRLREVVGEHGIENIGGNATLAVSLAAVLTAANDKQITVARYLSGPGPLVLPMPMVNVVSGGAHANAAVDIQDFLIVPVAAGSFAQAIEWAQSIREKARDLALAAGFQEAALVADEGGLGVHFSSNQAVLELLVDAIAGAGFTPGEDVMIAIDAAANEFFDGERYRFASEARDFTSSELLDIYLHWVDNYPIISIEDPFAEDDWAAWTTARERVPRSVDLVGDDLFVTQMSRLDRGIETRTANSILVKANQNGLFTATQEVIMHAKSHSMRTVVSARSGDTEESWLADLAVGWSAEQIKVGSTHRSERTAKWNRLLKFEATDETYLADPWKLRS